MSADDTPSVAKESSDPRGEFRFFRRRDRSDGQKVAPTGDAPTGFDRRQPVDPGEVNEEYLELKVRLHQKLIEEINLSAIEKMPRDDLRIEVRDIIVSFLKQENETLNHDEQDRIVDDVIDELLGFGPLGFR